MEKEAGLKQSAKTTIKNNNFYVMRCVKHKKS